MALYKFISSVLDENKLIITYFTIHSFVVLIENGLQMVESDLFMLIPFG